MMRNLEWIPIAGDGGSILIQPEQWIERDFGFIDGGTDQIGGAGDV